MASFYIGQTEFGIGEIHFSDAEEGLLFLEITGDEATFEQLTEDYDESEWSWALYAPKLYFWHIPYSSEKLIVDDRLSEAYAIALYMMAHNAFTGTINIADNMVHINGEADSMGKTYPVKVTAHIGTDIKQEGLSGGD